jgi:hypothetical protein
MISASNNYDKMGFKSLNTGIFNKYFLNNKLLKLFFICSSLLAIIMFFYDKKYFYIIILMLFIYLIIGAQWTTSSHGSRYPMYVVIFTFISLAIFFIKLINNISSNNVKLIMLICILILSFSIFEPLKYVEGVRHIYIPHIKITEYMNNTNISPDIENQILFLGWPSIKFGLLQNNKKDGENYQHTFGWGNVNLTEISSKKYIINNNITYFLYDQTGTDYFDSSVQVKKNIEKHFSLKSIKKIGKNNFIILYEVKNENITINN